MSISLAIQMELSSTTINIQDDVTTAFGGLLQVVERTRPNALGSLLEVLVGQQRK